MENMRYSEQVLKLIDGFENKSQMIKLALNKEARHIIEKETSFMDEFYKKLPMKIRCLAIRNDWSQENFPKCPNCGNPVSYDKEYQSSFNSFCSDKCSKEHGRLPQDIKNKLLDKEFLYDLRFHKKMSYTGIGKIIGVSELSVRKYCELHKFPMVDMKMSDAAISIKLMDKDYLIDAYNSGKTFQEIADDIGSSKATVALAFKEHEIAAKAPNSYPRKFNKRSIPEIEMEDYIRSLGVTTTSSNRILEGGLEIDILCGDGKVGFEYNGTYSHSEAGGKDRTYHLKKTTLAQDNGIKLFHIFGDSWALKKDITKSIIASKLGIYQHKTYARKCKIVELEKHVKGSFLEQNHLQGNDNSKYDFGLEYNGDLVAVMTFCKSRFNKNYTWELSRFACKQHTMVHGGFSKLLNHFRKLHQGSIISYADRTISFGDVYKNNGFALLKINPPSYTYITERVQVRQHRAGFMKSRIDAGELSESDAMKLKGYHKVWNCGTMTFILE